MPKKKKNKFFVTHAFLLSPILVIFLALLVLILTSDPTTVFTKKAKFGDINLSGKTIPEGKQILDKKLNDPIYLDLEASSRAVALADLGISIDYEKLNLLTKRCPYDKLKIFCKGNSNNKLGAESSIKINNEKLTTFLDGFEEGLQFLAGNTIISFDDFSFRPVSQNAKIELDRRIFNSKGEIANLIGMDRISIGLNTKTIDQLDTQKITAEYLVENMSYPMLIKYGGEPIYIPGDIITSFIETNIKDGAVHGFVDSGEIAKYLKELGKDYASDDVRILHNESVEAIRKAILFRAADYEINNAVILPLEGKPKTNGKLANKYLEIVKSQQRLYRFEGGKLKKTYIISTGLTWDTPSGEFEVLGKQKMTISYYDAWYMPNYLPIGTISGYRFGFHAIPYHMDGAGNIYSRDPNTMGSPATGGCIQLGNDDSLELYAWADVGTPVYIYE